MNDPQAELERLEKSANEHYGRKEYSIAVECYRAALKYGMKSHGQLFNFGYSLAATGNHSEAAQIYQQSILAGSGAAAHNNLGCALEKLGKHTEARDTYRKATQLEPSNVLYWRNLAGRLSHLKEQNAVLEAREKLVACRGCTANDWNQLGNAREAAGDIEGALSAYRSATRANPNDSAFFFNIALMNERLGRSLDAYHSCRHSLLLNDSYEHSLKMMPRLEGALKNKPSALPRVSNREYIFVCPHCNQSISATESFAETEVQCPTCSGTFTTPPASSNTTKEIGPHDYVNPFVLLDLTEIDEQPEAYEWFDQPSVWEELIGSLNRRRRKLKAELELNDGALGWLPKLCITDQVVHRVLADLDDDGWHADHWAVFRMPLLRNFLMFGELDYFYSREHQPYPLVAEIAGADTDDYEHEDFISFISPFFALRLTVAIKALLDTENYEAVTALFATRLPVTVVDFDEALEPVRRHFAKRRKILGDLETKLENSDVNYIETVLDRAGDEASILNILPAQHGAKLCEDMCRAYRSVSIALANHRGDYIASERALKSAELFKVSETTKERLAGDRTTIEGLIQRKRTQRRKEDEAEKRHTLRLDLTSWFRKRTLEVTPTRFSWGEENISADNINAVRFGITIKYTNGIRSGCDSILAVRGVNGKIIWTNWLDEGNFSTAVQSVIGLYSTSILTGIIAAIERGESVSIGAVNIGKQGLGMVTGIFTSTSRMIPWSHVVAQQASGSVYISSMSDPKAKITLSTRNDWNACMITTLVEIMKSSSK